MGKKIVSDSILWIIASIICILWRAITLKSEIWNYLWLFAIMLGLWILLSLVTYRYHLSYKKIWLWQDLLLMVLVSALVLVFTDFLLLPNLPLSFSPKVANTTLVIVAILDCIAIICKHYWKFAINVTTPPMIIRQRSNATVSAPDALRSEASVETIHQSVLSLTTEDDYQLLLQHAHLDSKLTKVIANTDRFSFLQIEDYRYSTLVDLTLLNNAKGINRRFCIVNEKLPDNGHYVCCYRPQEYVKSKILSSYPRGINYLVYAFWFLWRRVIPRLLITSRLHYDITKGKKRMLSRTEVLGRLYYCGFAVDNIIPSGHIEYVFAHRHSQPYEQEQMKVYGPIIKLPRVCKNREIRYFYKFRTMHPYSEYIQQYVFDQRGGMNIADKSDDDWRITTWGRFLRKYWLDELPMLLNWLKGDCKLVGIRPLSKTMFDQYPKDLQNLRTQTKPGLIPPFYVDHPKTFDELYASEYKYLNEYLRHPFLTDLKYFFLTMHSILFTKMHSA